MTTREQNDFLTRAGPRTPMGDLMRRYWIPALLSSEIAEPDCPPVRLKLLGEAADRVPRQPGARWGDGRILRPSWRFALVRAQRG